MMCGVVRVDIFFFKQETAYEMRISDWSSDVCSSDLKTRVPDERHLAPRGQRAAAFDGNDAVERGLAVGARGGETLRQARVIGEGLARPIIVAAPGQYFGRGLPGQYVERNLLADAVHRAIAVAAYRGAVGCAVGRNGDNLVFFGVATHART